VQCSSGSSAETRRSAANGCWLTVVARSGRRALSLCEDGHGCCAEKVG
jgi:hypothetical protein